MGRRKAKLAQSSKFTTEDASPNDTVIIRDIPRVVVPPHRFLAATLESDTPSSIENLSHLIYRCKNFFSSDECALWIEFGEDRGFECCDQRSTRDMAHRKQGRLSFESTDVADAIFCRLLAVLQVIGLQSMDGQVASGCLSNIRMYRYNVGDSFGKHIDESSCIHGTESASKLTLLVYLNGTGVDASSSLPSSTAVDHVDVRTGAAVPRAVSGECTSGTGNHLIGGETAFYKYHSAKVPLVAVAPEEGALLLHAHGNRCLTHEALPVLSGVKYVLRTDVVFSPPVAPTADASTANNCHAATMGKFTSSSGSVAHHSKAKRHGKR